MAHDQFPQWPSSVRARPTQEEPVFLVGCPRSGTTLLQRILDSHSDMSVMPETHFIRRLWLKKEEFGPLEEDSNLERVLDVLIEMPEFGEMGLDAEAFRGRARRIERSYPALFQLLMHEFRGESGVAHVGEKTPNHLLYMREIESMFPRARFVHIVRDPRAVVSSWRTVPWSTGTLAGDAAVWRRYMRAARLRAPGNEEALLTIRYEELVRDPGSTVKSVCRFLSIPYEEGMLETGGVEPATVNVAREPWKENVSRPVDAARIDRWRSSLSRLDVLSIEAIVWPEMSRWGYAPDTPRLVLGLAGWTARIAETVGRRLNAVQRRLR